MRRTNRKRNEENENDEKATREEVSGNFVKSF